MDFLKLESKTVLVFGVANKKSVAYHIARTLEECGAQVVYVVRSEDRKNSLAKLLADRPVFVCDVEHEDQIENLKQEVPTGLKRSMGWSIPSRLPTTKVE